ncbi:MAG: dihydroxy-acid dehydratase, partial [Acinetobacter sp.]
HVTPEAYDGGPIGLVKNGDKISINAETREITLHISNDEMDSRRAQWQKPRPKYTSGALAKFAKLAVGADKGAVTDLNLDL